jgi:hypothetical protein
MAASMIGYDEPLCLSSLMRLQKSVDKLARSLEEKIPTGMAIKSSKPSNAMMSLMPSQTTTTPSILAKPWSSLNRLRTTELEYPEASNETFEDSLMDFGTLLAVFAVIWMTTTILMLFWIRMSDLGYKTSTVNSILKLIICLTSILKLFSNDADSFRDVPDYFLKQILHFGFSFW